MKDKITLIIRIVLGLALLVFGLNKFMGFMPELELDADAVALWDAFVASGYVLEAVGVVEIVVGVLLLLGVFVPLALVLLAPISVNIVLFHVFLDPAEIVPAAVVAALNLFLMFQYRSHYSGMLQK